MAQLDGRFRMGIDLGAAQVKVAVVDAAGRTLHTALAAAQANTISVLAGLLRDLSGTFQTISLGVTGAGRDLLPPSLASVSINEITATAVGVRHQVPGAHTVIDIGGQSSKWILLGADPAQPLADFSTNGLCAAGAGVFLDQQAARLGLTVQELSKIAGNAVRGASVAGRCSVFAKSDMIHLQQNGTPREEIAYGLCQALVRTFATSVLQGRTLDTPVALVGGCANNRGLVRAFREHFHLNDADLVVSGDAPYLGAWGAAWQSVSAPPVHLDLLISELERRAGSHHWDCRSAVQAPLLFHSASAGSSELGEPAPEGILEAFLGIDVGSVSTDLAILDRQFRLLQGVYLPTQGQPLEALRQGLHQIRMRFGDRIRVISAGCTGSGRHLAAKLVGADVVRNEITAQAVSAAHYCPRADTIFEIGGQDSKFISLRDGVLTDFEMNKICSGGTGSFLEEQAQRLGIQIQDEFSEFAFRSAAPYNLGSRCTVFMDSELGRAQELGVPLEDLCAGLAYSVARNYLEKVVAGHPIGQRIVFQGGTASNQAVVAAFRRLLGCDVAVHPYNRLSGAIGAALLAARAIPVRSRFGGFNVCEELDVRSFGCRHCDNRCQVNRVRSGSRFVHFGDICERYSERDTEATRFDRPFAEMFAERDRLFERFVSPGGPESYQARSGMRIGLLRASQNWEYLPFWAEFLRGLGFVPVIAPRATADILERSAGALPSDVCLPIKVAVAEALAMLESGMVNRIFVPAVAEFQEVDCDRSCHSCLYTQELPNLLRSLRDPRICTAQYVLADGLLGRIESCAELAGTFGRSPITVQHALGGASELQSRFSEERLRLGRIALSSNFDRAVVVLGRPYNVYDPLLNLSLARHLDRLGLAAIPWDLLPLQNTRIPARWRTLPWRYCREQIRTLRFMRHDPRLFALMVSSFGCGPDAFTTKHVDELLRGTPHLLLEFDEHRGEAGLLTRLEAFADEMDVYCDSRKRHHRAATVTPGPRAEPAGRRFYVPPISEHSRVYAAVLRAAGHQATVLPQSSEESMRLGERYCSGRECHPYVVMAGDLAQFIRNGARPSDVFLVPDCAQPCLIRQYGDAMRILKTRMGVGSPEIWQAAGEDLLRVVGFPGLARLYEGFLATDLLLTLALRLRCYEREPGSIDRILNESLDNLENTLSMCGDAALALKKASARMWAVPRRGEPGDLPVVGITGDLYTRVNDVGNHDLVRRLESMGCEVWLGASWALNSDLATIIDGPHAAGQGRIRDLALDGLAWMVTERTRQRMRQALPPDVRSLIIDPSPAELLRLAQPYVGPATSNLIVLALAKLADFLSRGAAGAVSAAGVNCAVGALIATALPALRADFQGRPLISLCFGAGECPADRMRLETFGQQVLATRRCAVA